MGYVIYFYIFVQINIYYVTFTILSFSYYLKFSKQIEELCGF